MATVIVRSDADQAILMTETVMPIHIKDEHSSIQFLERLAWAIEDENASHRIQQAGDRQRIAAAQRASKRLDRRSSHKAGH